MSIDNLLQFPSDIRQNILHLLPCVDTHRYSQVAKACLADVQDAAKLWQYDITLAGEITSIVFDMKDQTVQTLLYQKLKVETLAFYFTEFFAKCLPEIQKDILEGLADQSEKIADPLSAVFDLNTKKCSGEELGDSLSVLFDKMPPFPDKQLTRILRSALKVIQPVCTKAILRHPNAKDISVECLAKVLFKTIGAEHRYKCIESTKLLSSRKITIVDETFTVYPPKMLEAGKVNDCRIPKLIFSHSKAAKMRIKNLVGVMLICAVRYRNLTLVQMILEHRGAKHLKASDLKGALKEAKKAGEEKIVKALQTFEKAGKCIVS